MHSLQLLQLTERGRNLWATRRKNIILAGGGAMVAGGVAAYIQSQYRRKPDHVSHCNGVSENKKQSDNIISNNKASKLHVPHEKEGPVKAVVAILISRMGLKGARYLLALVAIALLRTAAGNRLAKAQGLLLQTAFLRNQPAFLRLIVENLLLGLFHSTLFSTTKYVTGSLSLQFRKILSKLIHTQYFQNMAYYKVSHVDGRLRNPEQRIASDIPKFCSELSEYVQEYVMAITDGIFFTWRLCSYASPKYILWMLAYSRGANALSRMVSPSFGFLMAKEQQLEGEYRQLHSRLRTHAESIAFYGGDSREESNIQKKFETLIGHTRSMIYHTWWFSIVQELIFRSLGSIVGNALMIEPFIFGSLRSGSSSVERAETLGKLKYHGGVILHLFTAVGILSGYPQKLHRLRGYASRIHELITISKELSDSDASSLQTDGTKKYVSEANYIEFDGVKVVTPTGNVLVENLNLKVEQGSNLLVTGPNGSGKSSLFRVLGGLWPLVSGHVVKPGVGSDLNKEIFYVPQRPYMAVGTLRDQLIYPLTADQELEPLSEEEMVALLRYVDLQYLLDRYPREKEINWGDELSLGEQQRLGMARLFYHKPKFAILDECTSAVTTDMEERFCARVQSLGMSCVTISHRPALAAFHDVVLSLNGEGGWTVHYKREGSSVHAEAGLNAVHLSESERLSDAMAVQSAFSNREKDPSFSTKRSQSYTTDFIASSSFVDHDAPITVVPQLQSASRTLKSRVAALLRVLVPTAFDKHGAKLVGVAVLMGLTSLIADTSVNLHGKATKYILEHDASSYIRLFGVISLLNAASCFISPSLSYLTSKLSVEWRIRLTKHLMKNYFSEIAYYKVFNTAGSKLDADQRITQDVEKLTTDWSNLLTSFVKPSIDIVWLTWRMKLMTGNRGVSMLYVYMILGLGILKNLTPDFSDLASREQELEGSFRFMHERLRTHAESIAFFGGGAREKAVVESRLQDLLDHSNVYIKKKWLFGILDDFVGKQLPQSVSYTFGMLFAMEYKGDHSLVSTQGELADGLRYIQGLASQSFSNFGELLQLHKKCTELSGGIRRVSELEEILDAAQYYNDASTSSSPLLKSTISHCDDVISFSDVDIITPGAKMLARKLTFDLQPGKSLLVTGPNGSGKTCVFRVLRGLWPLGGGRLVKPCQRIGEEAGCGVFYVPQCTYMCLGTLRDQIIYPLSLEEAELRTKDMCGKGKTFVEASNLLDTNLTNILENVKLLYLLEREGGLDAEKDNWADILSLGEQQRLGMARLFFHKPKFGILDECTNATSIDVEEHLYRIASDMGITFITSSQRPALIPFHSEELRLVDGEGNWELHSIKASS